MGWREGRAQGSRTGGRVEVGLAGVRAGRGSLSQQGPARQRQGRQRRRLRPQIKAKSPGRSAVASQERGKEGGRGGDDDRAGRRVVVVP
jgi:hypothetical protein